MAEQKANDAAQALLKSFQETYQVITESIAATQERTTGFAQSFFTKGMDIFQANQAVAQNIVDAQERTTEFARHFLEEGVEVLKANQAVAEHLVVAQERTAEFARHFFTEGRGVLEAHQTAAQSLAALQERNINFFQSFFTESMEAIKKQTESAQILMQELGQKTQEQQEAFQQLALQSMASYLEFLSPPLSVYQQSVQAAQAAIQQPLDAEQQVKE